MFSGPFDESIIKRGREKKLIEIDIYNIRDWAADKHKTVDDTIYGGGAGMLMKPEPLAASIESIRAKSETFVILTSPRGRLLTNNIAKELSQKTSITIVCGRYEGVDERVRKNCVDDEISIGDFVLSGGELAAMVIVDAVSRFIPGVLGSDESAEDDSFSDSLLEYPQYTRPPVFMGESVPDILLSGNHEKIRKWRRLMSLIETRDKRPDIFNSYKLSKEDIKLLGSFDEK